MTASVPTHPPVTATPPAPPDVANIPAELRSLKQWVCWRIVERDGKPTKQPLNARTGKLASTTNPETWAPFAEAMAAFEGGLGGGVGFVFTAHDPFTGVDLDHCRDVQTGAIKPWAVEIIERLDSYTEVSVSGTGVHVILRATLPPGGRRKGNVEMYDRDRYFICTGRILE